MSGFRRVRRGDGACMCSVLAGYNLIAINLHGWKMQTSPWVSDIKVYVAHLKQKRKKKIVYIYSKNITVIPDRVQLKSGPSYKDGGKTAKKKKYLFHKTQLNARAYFFLLHFENWIEIVII